MKQHYYTIATAAQRMGRSKVTVLKRIKRGDLKAEMVGGVWFIQRKAFKNFCRRFNYPLVYPEKDTPHLER